MFARLAVCVLIFCWQPFVSARSDEIPFTFQDGFIWIEATAPGHERPLKFVLDTGAGRSVIDLSVAQKAGKKFGKPVKVQGVHSEVSAFWPIQVSASANRTILPGRLLALDLSALSGKCSNRIDGLLGFDFFQNRVVQIDFEKCVIQVADKVAEVPQSLILKLDIRPCGFRVPLTVNGRANQWVRLDTGCVSALQWVAPQINPAECSGRRLAVGLDTVSLFETSTTVEIGSFQFDHVTTGIHQKPIFSGEAGLLGMGLLKEFRQIVIDAKKGRLILTR